MRSRAIPEQLLDEIYCAATDGSKWPSVLQQVAEFTGGAGGIIYGLSAADGRTLFEYNGGLDEKCSAAYRERHGVNNPWAIAMLKEPVGKLVLSDEIVAVKKLRNTAFYDEVLRPQGIAHNAMACGDKTKDVIVALNICRTERSGAFDDRDRLMQKRILPHLERSLVLGRRCDGYRALYEANCLALDQLSSGIMLLDATGIVIFANRAAEALARSNQLVFSKGRLRGLALTHQKEFSAAVKAVAQDECSRAVRMVRSGKEGHLSAVMVSARGNDVDRFATYGSGKVAVMVFLSDPQEPIFLPLSRLIDSYGLTASEARVALSAGSGEKLEESRHKLGISSNTLKTHLRRVYAKTGTRGQAQLVRLVATLAVSR